MTISRVEASFCANFRGWNNSPRSDIRYLNISLFDLFARVGFLENDPLPEIDPIYGSIYLFE